MLPQYKQINKTQPLGMFLGKKYLFIRMLF